VADLDAPPAQRQREVEHDVGELGQVVGELLDREQAGEVLGEQAEDLGVMAFAHHVHLALHVGLEGVELGARLARKAFQSGACCRGCGRRASRRAGSDGG
jgi:hypothetical protein